MAKLKIPKANKGYGYAGVWSYAEPTVGWMAPMFVTGGNRKYPDMPPAEVLKKHAKGERLFLCEITIKPLTDKKGRPITKIVK